MVSEKAATAKHAVSSSHKITSAALAGITFVGAVTGVASVVRSQYSGITSGEPQTPSAQAPQTTQPSTSSLSTVLSAMPTQGESAPVHDEHNSLVSLPPAAPQPSSPTTSYSATTGSIDEMGRQELEGRQTYTYIQQQPRVDLPQEKTGQLQTDVSKAQQEQDAIRHSAEYAQNAFKEAWQNLEIQREVSRRAYNEWIDAQSEVQQATSVYQEAVKAVMSATVWSARNNLNSLEVNLSAATNDAQASDNAVALAQADVDAKRAEVNSVQSYITSLKDKENQSQKNVESLSEHVAQLQSEVDNATDDDIRSQKEADLTSAQADQENAQQSLDAAKNELAQENQHKTDVQEALNQANTVLATAQKDKADAEQKVQKLQQQVDTARIQLDSAYKNVQFNGTTVTADANVADFFAANGWNEAAHIVNVQSHEIWQHEHPDWTVDKADVTSAASLDNYARAVDAVVTANGERQKSGLAPLKIDADYSAVAIDRTAALDHQMASHNRKIDTRYPATEIYSYGAEPLRALTDTAASQYRGASRAIGVGYSQHAPQWAHWANGGIVDSLYLDQDRYTSIDATDMQSRIHNFQSARDAAGVLAQVRSTFEELNEQYAVAQADEAKANIAYAEAQRNFIEKQNVYNASLKRAHDLSTQVASCEVQLKAAQEKRSQAQTALETLEQNVNARKESLDNARRALETAQTDTQYYELQLHRAQEFLSRLTKKLDEASALKDRITNAQVNLRIANDRYELSQIALKKAIDDEAAAERLYEAAKAVMDASQNDFLIAKQHTDELQVQLIGARADMAHQVIDADIVY
ncbi:hypothetical protein ACFQY8_03815 [Alloscardovia venturai]|uniref:Chromosome partition protein Smc n=1 Tax=Alloscardovia venturai TaxID=1769421 RepID=A0ABW2Y3N6_9BIFI